MKTLKEFTVENDLIENRSGNISTSLVQKTKIKVLFLLSID